MKKLLAIVTMVGVIFTSTIPYKPIPLMAATTVVSPTNLTQAQIAERLEFWANKYNIPPVILKALAWMETGWRQFDSTGQPLMGKDGVGIGIMQISSYDPANTTEVEKLKTDINYNIERGCQLLNEKWRALPKIGNSDRNVLENWYFAIWGYNGWKSTNNPNNPDGKGDGAYQDAIFGLIGTKYNPTITFAPGATRLPRASLPPVATPSLDSVWDTPEGIHYGDLKVTTAALVSTGGLNGDASGDYWFKYSKPTSYYAIGFYNTAYRQATDAEKPAIKEKLLNSYKTLISVADGYVADPNSSQGLIDRARKYYSIILASPQFDQNIVSQAKAGLIKIQGSRRLFGDRAEDTAIKISQQGFQSADSVVLARVDRFQDALAGAPLAKKLNAPILLTSPYQLDTEVLKEIKRLGATKVYILGGEGAVKQTIVKTLDQERISSERIFGLTAADTAVEIAKRVGLPEGKEVIIASDFSFADALSASAPSAALGIPILLTERNSLSEATKKFIEQNGVQKVIIIGGKVVITDKLDAPGGPLAKYAPERIAGLTLYDTMLEVVKYFKQSPDQLYIATGQNFPDGLSGGAVAALTGSPMLLVDYKKINDNTLNYLTSVRKENNRFFILGGKGSVSEEVEQMISNILAE